MTDTYTPTEQQLRQEVEALRELCAVVVELTRMRQSECKHLCIENFAPELLQKLIRASKDKVTEG